MAIIFVDNITPTGTQDGVNQTFGLPAVPNPASSLSVFLNGVLQDQGTDYNLAGSNIVYTTATPEPGDIQLASFRYDSGGPSPSPVNTSVAGTNFIGAQVGAFSRENFITLSNRLLQRCPAIGINMSQQFINDSWRTLQSRREWSFRRRSNTFAPPTLYSTGYASTNVSNGNATLVTGSGTNWSPTMIGQQIRIGGLLYPFYTIVAYISPTQLLIDQPWAGPDVSGQAYTIYQIYYPVPVDFGYMYAIVSVKDGYKLWTNLTETDLAVMDPQRTTQGQTYAAVYRDYAGQYGGIVGPVIPVTSPIDPGPISTTSYGFTYPVNASYIIQVVTGGLAGTATYQWLRAGQTGFQPIATTDPGAVDLTDGVQIYWPTGVTFIAGDLFIINCQAIVTQNVPRYELWPGPTFSGYLYPYIYIAKELDLTVQQPALPPFIANRGEVLLEMGMQKCAEYPGADADHINIYHDLRQARYHEEKVREMLIDLERNDEEVGVSNIDYEMYPFAPAPWMDGGWQQRHSPWLNG